MSTLTAKGEMCNLPRKIITDELMTTAVGVVI